MSLKTCRHTSSVSARTTETNWRIGSSPARLSGGARAVSRVSACRLLGSDARARNRSAGHQRARIDPEEKPDEHDDDRADPAADADRQARRPMPRWSSTFALSRPPSQRIAILPTNRSPSANTSRGHYALGWPGAILPLNVVDDEV